jgi:hypothetical protein
LKSNTTLDSFLLKAKRASGGQIIPETNMNFYTSNLNISINQKSNYCDPHNSTNCGPSYFFEVSSELLSLKAVSSDPHRTLELDAWDQFVRDCKRAGLPSDTPTIVLQELKAQGWVNLIIKTATYVNLGEISRDQVGPVVSARSSPYMQPPLTFLSKMSQNNTAFVKFDRQIQNSPHSPTAMVTFLANLTRSQKAVALTNLASLQGPDNYTFVYPIFTYTARNQVEYVWDANTAKQKDGQPFINLIEQLMTEYS